MKTISKFMLLVAVVAVGFGCEPLPNTPDIPTLPDDHVPGLEGVTGVVSNENGDLLKGIQIEVFYDEELKEYYPKKEKYYVYSDEQGHYEVNQVARYGVDFLDVYVVATDTAGIYETQVQKGQIKFVKMQWEDGSYDVAGGATINFILKKKQ